MTKNISALVAIVLLVLVAFLWHRIGPKTAIVTFDVPSRVAQNAEITVPLTIDTQGSTINAGEFYLTYDPARIEVKSLKTDTSIFSLWITGQPSFSNDTGTLNFAGGLPTPGFIGKGTVAQVVLVVKGKGTTHLSWDPKSRMLKNDGAGTAVPLRLPPVTLSSH
jgi:hypothetical protein